MLLLNVVFTAFVVITCAPAWRWGGWEGRRTCAMLVGTGVITGLFTFFLRTEPVLPTITFTLDVLLACGLFWIALKTDRYWPLWIVSFHSLSIMTFLAWQFAPGEPSLFRAAAGFWSIPQLIVLCVGPILDRVFSSRSGQADAGAADRVELES